MLRRLVVLVVALLPSVVGCQTVGPCLTGCFGCCSQFFTDYGDELNAGCQCCGSALSACGGAGATASERETPVVDDPPPVVVRAAGAMPY